jgi:hypothetical protein
MFPLGVGDGKHFHVSKLNVDILTVSNWDLDKRTPSSSYVYDEIPAEKVERGQVKKRKKVFFPASKKENMQMNPFFCFRRIRNYELCSKNHSMWDTMIHGCQISLGTTYQKLENIPNDHQICLVHGHKTYKIAITCSNWPSKVYPNFDFLV